MDEILRCSRTSVIEIHENNAQILNCIWNERSVGRQFLFSSNAIAAMSIANTITSGPGLNIRFRFLQLTISITDTFENSISSIFQSSQGLIKGLNSFHVTSVP